MSQDELILGGFINDGLLHCEGAKRMSEWRLTGKAGNERTLLRQVERAKAVGVGGVNVNTPHLFRMKLNRNGTILLSPVKGEATPQLEIFLQFAGDSFRATYTGARWEIAKEPSE